MKTSIEMMLDGIEYIACSPPDEVDEGIPYVTHTGTLHIGAVVVDVVVLNTGVRLITEESLNRAFSYAVLKSEELLENL